MASPSVVANSGSSSSIFLSARSCSSPPNLSPSKIANSPHLSPLFTDPPLFSSTTIPMVGSVKRVSSTHAMIYNTNISPSSERRSEENDSEAERLRSCDVYIGYCDRKAPSLKRFVNWLRAEMVMHGFSFFISYLEWCSDARSHAIARTAMEEAALGVVIVSRKSFSSPWSIKELKILLGRKKLVPIFFGLKQKDCLSRDIIEKKGEIWGKYGGTLWKKYEALEEEWSEAVDGLSQIDVKFEVSMSNMRDCVLDAISFIGKKLGRGDALEKLMNWKNRVATEEFPFTRNLNFIGRRKELLKLKLMLFGDDQMECDNDFINILPQKSSNRNNELHQMKNKEKMKGQRVLKESKEEIVMAHEHDPRDFGRFPAAEETVKYERKCGDGDLVFGKGIACISGESGTGKTELLLEFAYRYSQMYKMVLWISGEERYVRINYMNLMNLLGVDATIVDSEFCSDGAYQKHFEEIEGEAIRKVRRELMRGIPYLLVIDNLENEKDWWDGRNIVDLLPHFGGETHVIISTRLPTVMNIEPLKLSNLSSAESLSLMTRNLRDLKSVDEVALQIIGERLCRLPLGLALVRGILSNFSLDPPKLLEIISRTRQNDMPQSGEKEDLFKHNPFLLQLLDFLFFAFNQQKRHGKLAKKMMQVCCWFASSPIPISMLALATELSNKRARAFFLKDCCQILTSEKKALGTKLLNAEAASNMLIGVNLARRSPRKGFISFHDIIRIYAYKRGGDRFACSMVRAINTEGCLPVHLNHIWAACFLIFKFSSMPTVANLSVPNLLSFIRQFVLPLADHSFASLSQCDLIVDLLHRSTKMLESVENLILAGANSEEALSFCFASSSKNSILNPDPLIYQDTADLRAALLSRRAKFMVLCGHYEIGEQLCRRAQDIKEVINGLEHSETLSIRETVERLISLQPRLFMA